MTTILFVDSDTSALHCLSDWFNQHRPQWQILTATGFDSAIELSANTELACVVSDLVLADNSGVELLRHMTHKQPKAIRIGFSAEDNAELTLESLHIAHRFISKPEKAERVCEAIERSLALHQLLSDSQLTSLIATMNTLPVLPEVYDRLMLELASENFSIENVSRIIESDISLTATLLRIVNSPYYGMVTHVQSPAHAVNLLGVELIKNILLTDSIASQLKQTMSDTTRINELNAQAGIRGVLANRFSRLAKLEKRQIDHCQMAAMLSNFGELVLHANMIPPESTTDSSHNPDLVGSCILALWSLPDAIIEAVLHQNKDELPSGEITAVHVLRTICMLEQADVSDADSLEDSIRQDPVYDQLQIDGELLKQWLSCYSEMHNELKFAA